MRSRISKRTGKVIELVNIQHGFFDVLVAPENPSFLRIRRIVNKIFILLTGYPIFGLGFGGSLLDEYHVYDESSMHFLHKKGINKVFVSPQKLNVRYLSAFNWLKIPQRTRSKLLVRRFFLLCHILSKNLLGRWSVNNFSTSSLPSPRRWLIREWN